jgi:Na+-translocating ferredoxin:NAD+ oxidoreductase RNF subunit RnfB
MSIILITAIFASALTFTLGVTLGFFSDFFAVAEDPVVTGIRNVLPGANCGACGYPGCDNFATEVAAGNAPANACTIGGPSVVKNIAAITGVDGGEVIQTVAVLACQGSSLHTPLRGTYTGIETCRAAKVAGGTKLCPWGCLGFGDCVSVCKFDALVMSERGLPIVNYIKCTGCRLCINECPVGLFKSVEREQKGAIALCSNTNPVKQIVVKSCKIACFKCDLCVKNCPEHCISLDTQIPVVDYSKCNSCNACVEKCPAKVFKLIERDLFAKE